jgi:hypothetical protein
MREEEGNMMEAAGVSAIDAQAGTTRPIALPDFSCPARKIMGKGEISVFRESVPEV